MNTFKNSRLVVTGSYADAYTVPANTTAIVLSINLSNIDGANDVVGYAQWLDSSAANAATRIAHKVVIPIGYAVDLVANKIVLEAGDKIQCMADATSDVEATISVMEIS